MTSTELDKKRAEVEKLGYSIMNLGPTHPATHGIFQNILTMDGDIIIDAIPTVGCLAVHLQEYAKSHRLVDDTSRIAEAGVQSQSPMTVD